MTTVLHPAPAAGNPPLAVPHSVADLLRDLGGIDPARVRLDPPPGTATLADLIAVNERRDGPTCELVDGTLVEKAMGQFESWLAMVIIGRLMSYLETNNIGMVLGEAGVLRILPGIGRAGDVTFIAWSSLPDGRPRPREDKVPAIVPDLVVEVLSESNTRAEMTRKRADYAQAGVKQVWEIDPETRSATVYALVAGGGAFHATPVPADGTLDGGDILPGFSLSLPSLFERAERGAGSSN